MDSLSGNNPMARNQELLNSIQDLNQKGYTGSDLDAKVYHIFETIFQEKTKDLFKDEIVCQVQREGIRNRLREMLGLLRTGDVVCSGSQGSIYGRKGQFACASICLQAVREFLRGNTLDTEEAVLAVLDSGVAAYARQGFEGAQFFEDVYDENTPLAFILPDENLKGVLPDQQMPFAGVVSELEDLLIHLQAESVSRGGVCGVMTCNGETIVIGFTQRAEPLLFDSHGRPYQGMDKGASRLKFQSIEALGDHLQKLYKNPNERFSLHMVYSLK